MVLYHDPYIASVAFAGFSAPATPIIGGLALNPPASTFLPTNVSGLLNWAAIPGAETQVADQAMHNVIVPYYKAVDRGISAADISSFFISTDYTLPQVNTLCAETLIHN